VPGKWQPAPFYDVTFSPNPFGEHATSFSGFGKHPPIKALQKLADDAGFSRWPIALQVIKELMDVVSGFNKEANELGVIPQTVTLIATQIKTSSDNLDKILR
jgi:serine/threonine-protein kinase HipA